MPMYEFECRKCGKRFDELVFSANSSLDHIICPKCGSKEVAKLMSASAFGGGGASGGSCGPLPSGGFG